MVYLNRMKKRRFYLAVAILVLPTLFSIFLYLYFFTPVYAACPATDLTCQISEIQKEIDALKPAQEYNKQELASLRKQLASLKSRLGSIAVQLKKLEESIFAREVDLAYQEEILSVRVRNLYKKSRQYSPLMLFLTSANASDLIRGLSYRETVANQDRAVITQVSQELLKLKGDKAALERNQTNLTALQTKVNERAEFLSTEVAKVESYLAQLTSRQQQLIAQRLAGLNLPATLGAGPLSCVDDRNLDPGFRPAFAFFTYGIPHRVGMNQYGAYGRAKAGQSYQDILRAYYENIIIEKRPNINIRVQGYGSMSLEQYLLGIYEMPESWPLEAQKAQAVAARSYALAYTNNGANEICTTQKCQVYKGGNKGGNWEAAVRATEGEVAVQNGQAITAWYASTAGGYTFLSSDVGWSSSSWTKRLRDTSGDINGFSDLFSNAYDKESPCFYAAQGWRKEYGKSAWLKSGEVADIINVLLLARADSSTREHLYQTDKPHPYGGEVWNEERVKQELRSRGITPYSSISDISVDWDKGVGKTNSVSVSGDGGNNNFDASEFKNFFNLRAPANIQIVGPLFNIERK
jgi:SpoIID/LytB domain protein